MGRQLDGDGASVSVSSVRRPRLRSGAHHAETQFVVAALALWRLELETAVAEYGVLPPCGGGEGGGCERKPFEICADTPTSNLLPARGRRRLILNLRGKHDFAPGETVEIHEPHTGWLSILDRLGLLFAGRSEAEADDPRPASAPVPTAH